MADFGDPFGDAAPRGQPQPSGQGPGLMQEWTAALQDPRVRGALLSFGLNAMQPVRAGQTPLGHLAASIGTAAEGVTASEAAELAAEEKRSKIGEREGKLQIAGERLGILGEKLDISRREQGLKYDAKEQERELKRIYNEGVLSNRSRMLDIREQQNTARNEIDRLNVQLRSESNLDKRRDIESKIQNRTDLLEQSQRQMEALERHRQEMERAAGLRIGVQAGGVTRQADRDEARLELELRKQWADEKKAYDDNFMKPKNSPPFESFEVWRSKQSGALQPRGARPAGTPQGSVDTISSVTETGSYPPPPMTADGKVDEAKLKPGDIHHFSKSGITARWDGSRWHPL